MRKVNARNIDGATPLCDACHDGNLEMVRMLLEAGADVNPKLTFFTSPLHEAVIRGRMMMSACVFSLKRRWRIRKRKL